MSWHSWAFILSVYGHIVFLANIYYSHYAWQMSRGKGEARYAVGQPLTSSQSQTLSLQGNSHQTVSLCLTASVREAVMGQGTSPLWGAGAKPLALQSTSYIQPVTGWCNLPPFGRMNCYYYNTTTGRDSLPCNIDIE